MTREAVHTIYCHTHTASQKRYVGQTVQAMSYRWKQHVSAARRGGNGPLHRAIRKYGADAFVAEVLETVIGHDAANEAEGWWISHFGSTISHLGYNLAAMGRTAPRSAELRAKMRDVARKREAAMAPDQKRARAMRGFAGLPPEQRSEIAKRREANLRPEIKAAKLAAMAANRKPRVKKPKVRKPKVRPPAPPRVKKEKVLLTREQRRQVFLAREARKTPEERSAAVRKGHQKRTRAQQLAAAERLNRAFAEKRRSSNPAQMDLFGGGK